MHNSANWTPCHIFRGMGDPPLPHDQGPLGPPGTYSSVTSSPVVPAVVLTKMWSNLHVPYHNPTTITCTKNKFNEEHKRNIVYVKSSHAYRMINNWISTPLKTKIHTIQPKTIVPNNMQWKHTPKEMVCNWRKFNFIPSTSPFLSHFPSPPKKSSASSY